MESLGCGSGYFYQEDVMILKIVRYIFHWFPDFLGLGFLYIKNLCKTYQIYVTKLLNPYFIVLEIFTIPVGNRKGNKYVDIVLTLRGTAVYFKTFLPGEAALLVTIYLPILSINYWIPNHFSCRFAYMLEYRFSVGCSILHATCWDRGKYLSNSQRKWQMLWGEVKIKICMNFVGLEATMSIRF